ncbi:MULTISPECIES: AraC family transcriptional regulator [unclassified Thalassolituus]|uniref:AraC family transcriptional regulator n=1 Tax=unclassified Thalassolituus TaxID=2624967 RepID=UPI0025D2E70E|nr:MULTISPECIES: AraC family transcriptional regulator [unclassified Thalassolituus]
MNMEQGYISTALIRPLLEAAGPAFFDQLQDSDEATQRVLKSLRDPDSRINSQDADELINLLVRQSGDESVCVQSANKFSVNGSCQLQHLFLCCNTLREALYYLEKFSSLLSDQLEVQVTRTRDSVIKIKLPVEDNFIVSTQRRRTEMTISTLLSWLRQLCGSQLVLTNIALPYPATQYANEYQQRWKADIAFNADECSIQFHSRWLDEGLHNTNPHILNMMKREVEEQYRKLARSGSLAERIRKALLQNKIRLGANQQEVADYFHISARTLNRHLHREETSLKQLVTSVRLETAKKMLSTTDDSIEQIALAIGLSGRRTLDRIFIKETNQSPAQYRQSNRTVLLAANS